MAASTGPVILYLTAMWQALVATTLSGVVVVDGPQTNSEPGNWLFVGYNGDVPDEYNEGATAQQSRMAFARVKQEDGQVTCAVVSVSGDPDSVPELRTSAYGFVSAAEDALRLDAQLGGLVMDSFVSDHRYSPVQTQQGAKVRVVFTVTYQAQL